MRPRFRCAAGDARAGRGNGHGDRVRGDQRALSGVGDDEQGVASGVLNTAIQIGAAAGIALLATASAGAVPAHPGDVVTGSVHVAGAAGAGLAGVGALLAWVAMRPARTHHGAAGTLEAAAGMGA